MNTRQNTENQSPATGLFATLAAVFRLPGRGASIFGLLALAALLVFPAAASADSQVCAAGSAAGQCSEPSGVAVDREAALLFVADKGNNRVDVFDAESGDFLRAFGWGVSNGASELQVCTSTCQAGIAGSGDGQLSGPLGIAADNDPASAAFGDVYVYDGANARVQRFHPSGAFVAKWGSAGNTAGHFESIRGIGVGPTGEVYVADTWPVATGCAEPQGGKFEKRLQRFTSVGAVNANFKLTDARCGQVESLAVGSSGEFYLANAASTGAVREYASGGGAALASFNASTKIAGLATDAGGEVFVADTTGEGEAVGAEHVATYTPAGAQTSTIYGDARRPMSALAPFSGPLGGLFAVSRKGGVFAIGSLPAGPAVLPGTTGVSEMNAPSATLGAQLNPEGRSATYHFEYVDDATFEASGFADATSTPQGGPVGPDFEPHAVSSPIGGLVRNTQYHMRLVAEDDLGHVTLGPESTFSTFGLGEFDVSVTGPEGEAVTQAGTHPFALTTKLRFLAGGPGGTVAEAVKDIFVSQPAGLVGNPTAVPRCTTAEFLSKRDGCPDASAVGTVSVELGVANGGGNFKAAVYDLQPPPGKAAKLGFWVLSVPETIELGVQPTSPFKITGGPTGISQAVEVVGASLTVWGVPASPAHDPERGTCFFEGSGICEAKVSEVPFLTLPRSCTGALETEFATDSWQHPAARFPDGLPDLADPLWLTGFALTHDSGGNPRGLSGCGNLGFGPEITAQPTSKAAESSAGLDFSLDVNQNEGIANPTGASNADVEKTVVTLPEGMTANPSAANGLGVCSEAQLSEMTAGGGSGGCPDASKLGTIEVETPILENHTLHGNLYLATPYQNPEGTLIALYMVIQDPELGVLMKLPLKVEPDPQTGQLITTGENLPPYPFSHFRLHFREGARSPLVTPPSCGNHTVKALLYPSTGAAPVESDSTFEILSGPNGGACPSGAQPFDPGFEAGSLNNAAGAYSPFDMRLTRNDGDQDLTRFSAKLPPGMIGKLAGTSQCSAGAIAQARSRTGIHGGEEERNNPSCPASSQIGRVLAGAGVGSILTYVPGELYLAGPYNGAPLSVVAIVPALAGPFDAGTVVTQEALRINPLTAEVEADGSSSDPIPHILKGIPLKVRDIRVYVDKPEFTLNPTSCEPSATQATLWAGGANVFSSADDTPHSASARFQAADCASLGFKPKLALQLQGSKPTRGGHPALRGTFTPRKGDANLKKLVLRLPHSAFLDQAHIRTICTRVQFAAGGGNGGGCPAGAVYGEATAYTPLLSEPLTGPVYLRSSDHNLPDFVAALHGTIDVEAVARIDSKHGGIRATFPIVPDAPLTKVVVNMQGGKKGLIINSTDLCAKPGKNKADAKLTGHNGKTEEAKPVVKALSCKKAKDKKKHKRRHR